MYALEPGNDRSDDARIQIDQPNVVRYVRRSIDLVRWEVRFAQHEDRIGGRIRDEDCPRR